MSVIVPTRNRWGKLGRCLKSVLESDYPTIEITVIDDASETEDSNLPKAFPNVRFYRNASRRLLSFSRNRGATLATGDILFFLDDDNVIAPDAISQMLDSFRKSESVGVVSPVIYRYDAPNSVWSSYIVGGRFPGFYILGTEAPGVEVETFSFHDAFMVKRDVFDECGRFDPANFPIHFSELDFAYRLHRRGYSARVNPSARVWHDSGAAHMHVDSVRACYTLRNRVILLKRYGTRSEQLLYVFGILPLLTLYYFVHHIKYSAGNRRLTIYNLLRGVVAGLAYRDPAATITISQHGPHDGHSLAELKERPLVSVLIPTKNSEATLSRCLDSLIRQTYPNIEILVVDNYSTDNTVSIAMSYKGVQVFLFGPERSAQLNFGASNARGRYVYRVDSDFVLEPTVIEEAVIRCVFDGFGVVTIHNTSDPTISFWSRTRKLERDCYADDTVNVAARFFDKSVFQSAGGFSEILIASEDYDIHNRLVRMGYKVGRIRSKEVHIGEPRRLRDVVQKHLFYGRYVEGFLKQNPGSLNQIGPVRVAYLRHWRDFLKDPRVTLGFFLYQYVRYVSACVGYLATKA